MAMELMQFVISLNFNLILFQKEKEKKRIKRKVHTVMFESGGSKFGASSHS